VAAPPGRITRSRRHGNESPAVKPELVLAGERQHGGQLSATLHTNQRGRRVYVNAAELTGLLIDLSVADAREFAWRLLEMTAPD
jgi:hypothetical protein